MAIDYGIGIIGKSSLSEKERASIVRQVIQILEPQIASIVYETTFASTADSYDQTNIMVGTGTMNFGIRVIMDSAVVGADKVPSIERRLIQTLEGGISLITHEQSYVLGTEVYNLVITLS